MRVRVGFFLMVMVVTALGQICQGLLKFIVGSLDEADTFAYLLCRLGETALFEESSDHRVSPEVIKIVINPVFKPYFALLNLIHVYSSGSRLRF